MCVGSKGKFCAIGRNRGHDGNGFEVGQLLLIGSVRSPWTRLPDARCGRRQKKNMRPVQGRAAPSAPGYRPRIREPLCGRRFHPPVRNIACPESERWRYWIAPHQIATRRERSDYSVPRYIPLRESSHSPEARTSLKAPFLPRMRRAVAAGGNPRAAAAPAAGTCLSPPCQRGNPEFCRRGR